MSSNGESFESQLKKAHAHYVLITCDPSSEEGKLEVSMSHDGDVALAAYLVEDAHEALCLELEEGVLDEEPSSGSEKKVETLLQNAKIG